jgi:hypothetical protein
MTTYGERRDKRFYENTVAALKDIEERALQLPQEERYAGAYGILRGYVETLLVNFAEAFSEEQLAEIRIVLDQLSKVTGEDDHLDAATRAKLDQLAQALRESDESFQVPEYDPHWDYAAGMHDQDQEQQGRPRVDIEAEDAEEQAHQDWPNDE